MSDEQCKCPDDGIPWHNNPECYYQFVPWEDCGKRPPEKDDENQPTLELAG